MHAVDIVSGTEWRLLKELYLTYGHRGVKLSIEPTCEGACGFLKAHRAWKGFAAMFWTCMRRLGCSMMSPVASSGTWWCAEYSWPSPHNVHYVWKIMNFVGSGKISSCESELSGYRLCNQYDQIQISQLMLVSWNKHGWEKFTCKKDVWWRHDAAQKTYLHLRHWTSGQNQIQVDMHEQFSEQ